MRAGVKNKDRTAFCMDFHAPDALWVGRKNLDL